MNEEIDYNEFLRDLILTSAIRTETLESILEDNQDCLYTGTGYRVLFFDREHISHVDISKGLEPLVDIEGYYESFSKTLEGTQKLRINPLFNHHFRIVLEMQINNGLDINKLFNKYKSKLEEETIKYYEFCKDEEEVLSILDSSFKIINHKPFS